MKQPKATLSQGHDITFDVPAVAIQGNLSEGFRIFGPFATMDDASDWSDQQPTRMLFGIGDWWIQTLEIPEEVPE